MKTSHFVLPLARASSILFFTFHNWQGGAAWPRSSGSGPDVTSLRSVRAASAVHSIQRLHAWLSWQERTKREGLSPFARGRRAQGHEFTCGGVTAAGIVVLAATLPPLRIERLHPWRGGAGNQGIPLPVLPCGVAEAKPSLPFRLRLSPTRRLWSRRRRRDEALSALPGDREEA
jgi:hypothetical protein